MNTTQNELVIETFQNSALSLRIAIVTETYPPEVNGVAMTLGRLVDGLISQGHQVQVIRPRQGDESATLPRAGLEEVLAKGVPLPAYGELRFGLPAKQRLCKLWSVNRPDVVHVVTEGPLGWSAVTAARKMGLPVTSSFHTNFQSYSQNYGVGLFKSPIDAYLRKLHNRTYTTLAPTREVALELTRRGYHNVGVMARGVDTQLFTPARRSEALRASWGVAAIDPVVILVGRLAREKNVNLVVAAFRNIQRRCPTARLVFVGDGPLRRSLEEMCPDAIFAGIRRGVELAEHYASGDLFLFSSLTETYGNVVPEALASGLAVLAYNTAAAKELIVNGENGVLVACGDEVGFVNASADLATSQFQGQFMRKRARESVQNLSWASIVERFAKTLREAVLHTAASNAKSATVTTRVSARKTQERLPHTNTTA